MKKLFLATAVSSLALTSAALADAPTVAVDIPPVYSLVATVMEGVGTPDLIVQQGASPHGYSLRPAEAEALQNADVVFWVSEELEPWLERSIDSLAADALSVQLMEAEGATELVSRSGATFEKHSHGDEEGEEGEDHDHEDHADADHDHEDEGHDHDEHDHGAHDPHSWLDPQNAIVWLGVIAEDLSEVDPENAETYAKNAAEGKAQLEALVADVSGELKDFTTNFIVFHDAYQYFENRFGISAAGSIRLSDATDPSPARIADIRDKVAELDITCAFAEPQFNPGLLETVFAGTDAKVGVLDPLGSGLDLGPNLYPQLIRDVADGLASCQ